MTGSKGLDKVRKFRDQRLQSEADGKGCDHQTVAEVVHTEYRGFHIPHPNGMEKLGKPQNRKGVGLGTGQDFRHGQKGA